MRSRIGPAVLALVGVACGSDPASLPKPAPELRVHPLEPDGLTLAPASTDATLVHGVQGGYHLFFDLRVRGLEPGQVLVERAVYDAAGTLLLLNKDRRDLVPSASDADWLESAAPVPFILCPSPFVMYGVPLRFDFAVTDDNDHHVAGSLTVTPHCPQDSASLCQMICAANG